MRSLSLVTDEQPRTRQNMAIDRFQKNVNLGDLFNPIGINDEFSEEQDQPVSSNAFANMKPTYQDPELAKTKAIQTASSMFTPLGSNMLEAVDGPANTYKDLQQGKKAASVYSRLSEDIPEPQLDEARRKKMQNVAKIAALGQLAKTIFDVAETRAGNITAENPDFSWIGQEIQGIDDKYLKEMNDYRSLMQRAKEYNLGAADRDVNLMLQQQAAEEAAAMTAEERAYRRKQDEEAGRRADRNFNYTVNKDKAFERDQVVGYALQNTKIAQDDLQTLLRMQQNDPINDYTDQIRQARAAYMDAKKYSDSVQKQYGQRKGFEYEESPEAPAPKTGLQAYKESMGGSRTISGDEVRQMTGQQSENNISSRIAADVQPFITKKEITQDEFNELKKKIQQYGQINNEGLKEMLDYFKIKIIQPSKSSNKPFSKNPQAAAEVAEFKQQIQDRKNKLTSFYD